MSNTVGGLVRLSKAAASGKAASTCSRVSGRGRGAAAGTQSQASLYKLPQPLCGLVNLGLEGSPEKGLVEGCLRAGE